MLDSLELEKLKNRDFFSKENNFKKYEHVKSKLIYGDEKREAPFVTLIIPTFKRENTLKQTIRSILAQQDFDDYEILIVDNEAVFDKTTKTEKAVRSFKSNKILYYKNEENIGMYANWNRCIELARSKWLCMVHDDDGLSRNHLKVMTSIIKQNKKIEFLACPHNHIDERYKKGLDINNYANMVKLTKKQVEFKCYKDYNLGFATMFLGAIFNRDKAIEVGGFLPDSAWVEDYLFVAKFAYYFNIYKCEYPLYLYRWGNNQSLKTEIWEDQIVYEHYLYKYISKRRKLLGRFYTVLSKYMTLIRMNEFISGKSFLKVKCNINRENVYKMCGFKDEKINKVVLIISKSVRKLDEFNRATYNLFAKNIKVRVEN